MPEPEEKQPETPPDPPETPQENPPADPPTPPADDKPEDKEDEFVDDKAEPDKFSLGDEVDKKEEKKEEVTPTGTIGEDDDKISSAVNKHIGTVNQRLDAVTDKLYRQSVDSEVQNILTSNPEYKPYEARIKRFVYHENRFGLIKQGLPVSTVVLEAIAPHLQKIGAAKAKAADAKANMDKVHGDGQAPKSGGGPDYSKMSNEDIIQMAEQVKSGQYKP